MSGNMVETWRRIPLPKNENEKNLRRVKDTNCWLSKSYDSSLGLIMVGVEPPNRKLDLENIYLDFYDRMVIEIEEDFIDVENCLTLDLESGCDAGILATVLDRMFDMEPSGRFRTDIMYKILEQVISLFKKEKRPPTKEDVIGAWGELCILEMVIASSPSPVEVQRRITSWESHSGRTIIDFNFLHVNEGLAIEVKTSISGREHHILGFSQITLPDDFKDGWLASLNIRDANHISGSKCKDIVDRIVECFQGNSDEIESQKKSLYNRIELRGPACIDERFAFILPEGGLRMIRMENIPKPEISEEITKVEWKVNLEKTLFDNSIDILGIN
jgi:hypothetical protein